MRDLNHRPGASRAHVPAQADAGNQKQTEARVFADDPERADARQAPGAEYTEPHGAGLPRGLVAPAESS